jgi:hypothetical protein
MERLIGGKRFHEKFRVLGDIPFLNGKGFEL